MQKNNVIQFKQPVIDPVNLEIHARPLFWAREAIASLVDNKITDTRMYALAKTYDDAVRTNQHEVACSVINAVAYSLAYQHLNVTT